VSVLEFVLAPDDADRLLRLKPLLELRAGRIRRRANGLVWHDTADGALALDGLTLVQSGGAWQLELLAPGAGLWSPGVPPPVIEQAVSLDQINRPLPAGLIQVARFDGLQSVLPLRRDGAAMTLTLLHGTVGTARRRRPASRVTLTGEATAVIDLALALTEHVDLAIPIASLAAEARAVATATAAAPRRRGPPQLPGGLPTGLSVPDAFSYVVGHLVDVILGNAPLAAAARDGPDPVHEMRVAVRRLRSTLALFRPAIGCPAVDAASILLKSLAERLAPCREWDVFVTETVAAVATALPDDPALRRLSIAAERRRRQAYTALRDWLRSTAFRRSGISLAGLAGDRAWLPQPQPSQMEAQIRGLDDFARHALARRLRKLNVAGAPVEQLDPTALHALRLRAKRMRYAAEVFAPLYPGRATRRFLRRLATLQDRLGHLNDGTAANPLLADLGATTGARAHAAGLVLGFLAARADIARGRIGQAWKRFHHLPPFWR
jgi:CHAD domain-containing protein